MLSTSDASPPAATTYKHKPSALSLSIVFETVVLTQGLVKVLEVQ